MTDDRHWIRTVGAPVPGDPRDGEPHEVLGSLPAHLDLEPWDDDPNDESVDGFVRYVKSDRPPFEDDEGRTVWLYEFRPEGDS